MQQFVRALPGARMSLLGIVFLWLSLTASAASPATILSVSGTIVDTDGFPLIGATVIEKGQTGGTVTDFDGAYTIEVQSGDAILSISYTGYANQEIAVNGRNVIDIIMEPSAAQLEQVVVIGYGTQQKADVTGSVSQLDGDELTVAPPPNLSAALAGKVTGVISIQTSGQPGFDDAAFQIRGRSTLGNNDPLILVDGVERPFSRLNPASIASVTVLKDAASTAVYGSRAANGVLLVTTKSGKVGPPRFNFQTSWGNQSPAGRPDLMDANQYVLSFRDARRNEGTMDNELPFPNLVEDAQAGRLRSFDWWESTLTNSAPQQRYSMSVNGGGEQIRYFFGYDRLNQEGFLEQAQYKQDEIRANIDADIATGLTFGVNLMGRLENRLRSADNDGEIFSNVLRANPLNPVFLDGIEGAEGLPAGALGFDGFSGNSFGDANRNGSDRRESTVLNSNITLNYELPWVKGLSARALYAFDKTFGTRRVFFTPYTIYQLDEATGRYDISLQSDNIRSLDETRNTADQQTTQLSLNYRREFGDHLVSGLALYERITTETSFLGAFRDGFISPVIDQFFAGNVINDENRGSAFQTARQGWVGRINYGYKSRYLLQANLRVDESFIFPENSRRGYFPAFSAGWRISEEPWMSNFGASNSLKVRGSWGITGNDRVGAFRFLSGFNFAGGFVENGVFQQGVGPTGLPNTNITWETATTTDIGLEASFLEGKFGFEVDYYQKRTEDILASRALSVPGTFGAELPIENIGVVDSRGWEFAVRHRNKIGPVDVGVSANLTLAENEIIFIDEPIGVNPATSQTGRMIGTRFGLISDGIFQSEQEIMEAPTQFGTLAPGDIRYRDINGRDADGNLTGMPDGQVNNDDRVEIGNPETPGLIYGFNFDASFKGLKLQLNFQGAGQFTRFIAPRGFLLGVGNNFAVLEDSWTPDNPDARYPRILPDGNANNNQVSDFFTEDISFLRLRNVQLSYDLAGAMDWFDQVGIENFGVVLSGTNLLTWSNVSIGDPEGGDTALFYPIPRVISLGLNIGF